MGVVFLSIRYCSTSSILSNSSSVVRIFGFMLKLSVVEEEPLKGLPSKTIFKFPVSVFPVVGFRKVSGYSTFL